MPIVVLDYAGGINETGQAHLQIFYQAGFATREIDTYELGLKDIVKMVI